MCPCALLGCAYCHLLLLFDLETSFLTRLLVPVLSLPNVRAWLWSGPAGYYVPGTLASWLSSPVMHTSQWTQGSHSQLSLGTKFWQWVSGGGWDMNCLPLHFQDLWFPLMIVLTVYFSCKGCSQGWISQSTHALASLPGLSLLELISAPHLLKGAVLKVPPRESSPCPAAPRDQHGHGF